MLPGNKIVYFEI